jgi:hypothetical protein
VGASALVTLPGDAKECSEGRSHNPWVAGSSPARPTQLKPLSTSASWSPTQGDHGLRTARSPPAGSLAARLPRPTAARWRRSGGWTARSPDKPPPAGLPARGQRRPAPAVAPAATAPAGDYRYRIFYQLSDGADSHSESGPSCRDERGLRDFKTHSTPKISPAWAGPARLGHSDAVATGAACPYSTTLR